MRLLPSLLQKGIEQRMEVTCGLAAFLLEDLKHIVCDLLISYLFGDDLYEPVNFNAPSFLLPFLLLLSLHLICAVLQGCERVHMRYPILPNFLILCRFFLQHPSFVACDAFV